MKQKARCLLAYLLGTDISDADFLQALENRFSTPRAFLEYQISKETPCFFLKPDHHQKSIKTIHAICPAIEARTIAAANQVCNHIFDLLGSGPTDLGKQIDWHVDFKTEHRFNPQKYYANVRPAPYPGGYDIKIPWELSRCQHFAWLGQAYWFTNDEKYAQEFIDQILDWIKQNPPQFGVNWACTMDVAIRAVSWLWGYYFFKDSPSLNDEFLLAFFKSLLAHGRHIFRNLENQGDFTGNHYLSNLVGLVYLGILCPEFKETRRWREFGLQELEREMFKQVYPDGVAFEASTSYHRLVTEMFLSAVILAQLDGHDFSVPFMERLGKMLEFVMCVTKPDGTVPLIGDNDNGRLHRLKVWDPPEREWGDFRCLLAIGAVLFEREDFAQAAGNQWEEAIWFFGEEILNFKQKTEARQLAPPQRASRSFPDAGLYIMRHNDCYLAISAGSNGQNGNGGHAHNDKLSFELYANGQTWIVDPGAYVYTADYEARNRFRSTAFHNTVQVDSREQNPLSSAHRDIFRLPDITQTRVMHWASGDEYILFVGEHHGYTRLRLPVIHKRIVFFDKLLSIWIINDQLSSREQHYPVTCLHFAPGLDVQPAAELDAGLCIQAKSDKGKIFIMPVQGSSDPPVMSTGAVSSGYGIQKSAPVARWDWDKNSREFTLAITANADNVKQVTTVCHHYREVYRHVADC